MTEKPAGQKHTKRDAEILTVLGIFLVVLAVPVLIGTIWAEGTAQVLVNVVAGLIVGGIGVAMVLRGRWTGRHLD